MIRVKRSENRGLKDLGDGLVMRRAVPEDAERLAEFHADVQGVPGTPEEECRAWVLDALSGAHPRIGADDALLVEDRNTGAVVSTVIWVSQTWVYDGIELGVGQPEMVGTAPEYRRRGLVRALMETAHERSAARGERLQVIDGIPWYYRQFGYEMGLEMDTGRSGYADEVPRLREGEKEAFRVREATAADVPFLDQVYRDSLKRYRMGVLRDSEFWRYELEERSPKNTFFYRLFRIVERAGEPVGFFALPPGPDGPKPELTRYEIRGGVSWLNPTHAVLRYMADLLERHGEQDRSRKGVMDLWLGSDHPAYRVLPDFLRVKRQPYTYYVRVADLPSFLVHIAPALERKLAESPLAWHTGEVRLNFYRSGLRLRFEEGRLAASEPWTPGYCNDGDASFPDLTFLQLLFGYRSLEELDYAFADCSPGNDETQALLNILFPKAPSSVWAAA